MALEPTLPSAWQDSCGPSVAPKATSHHCRVLITSEYGAGATSKYLVWEQPAALWKSRIYEVFHRRLPPPLFSFSNLNLGELCGPC